MLARAQRLGKQGRAHLRRAGVEEDGVVRVCERGVEIGAETGDAVGARQRLDLFGIAADEDRVGHHALAIGEHHAALVADRDDRADQVLVHPHAAGHAVHDDAKPLLSHGARLLYQ